MDAIWTELYNVAKAVQNRDRLIQTIEHFYGHLEIECTDRIGFTSVENKEDLLTHKNEIVEFCSRI